MLALVNTDAVVMLLAVCWDGEGTVVIGRRNWKSRYSGYCGGQPNLCAEILLHPVWAATICISSIT